MLTRKQTWADRFNLAVNIGIVCVAGFILFRPGGLIGTKLQGWKDNRKLQQSIAELWPTLNTGVRVDSLGRDVPVIVEFSDYQCPFCRNAHLRIGELSSSLRVGVVYKHLPLTAIHPHAEGAARAAICAEQQGRFREIHDRLFTDRGWEETQAWTTLAFAAGVSDTTSFKECLNSPGTTQRLADDAALAGRLRVQATPTFVGPAGTFVGAPTAESIAQVLSR